MFELKAHDPQDYITRLAPVTYDPTATCPVWTAFLAKVIPDAETRGYLQRVVGYALTGEISHHRLFILHGETGRNGRTTFTETILALLGDYARPFDGSALIKGARTAARALADARGHRLVIAGGVNAGDELNEALVAQITGGDTIKGLLPYRGEIEYRPTWKLWLSTNALPRVRGTTEGIWSRIAVIPFRVFIPPEERDPDMIAKLTTASERSGILCWALAGLRELRRIGLNEPPEVLEATRVYRSRSDLFGLFYDECANFDDTGRSLTTVARIQELQRFWAMATGNEILSHDAVVAGMAARGHKTSEKAKRVLDPTGKPQIAKVYEDIYFTARTTVSPGDLADFDGDRRLNAATDRPVTE